MSDIKSIVNSVLDLADKVNDYLPGAPVTQATIDLGRRVTDLIDHFGDEIPLDKQAEAQEARRKIAERVTAKSKALSASLRG